MSTVHLCDRCGVAAVDVQPLRSVSVPVGDPSTAPVPGDMTLNIGVTSPQDFCAPCLASTLVEYALATLAPSLNVAMVQALSARIDTVLRVK